MEIKSVLASPEICVLAIGKCPGGHLLKQFSPEKGAAPTPS